MAIRDAEFGYKLSVTDDAKPNIDRAGKAADDASDRVSKLATAVTGLNSAVQLAQTAFNFAKGFLESTVGAYKEAEDGVIRLGDAIRRSGESDVRGAIDRFTDLADRIQENSAVEADHAVQLAASAKAMGLTNDMTEELVQTSVDLAGAFNVSVDEAFSRLKGSLKGAGRGVAEFRPELAALSPEALKSGEAIRLLGKEFEGAGKSALEMFGPKLQQTKNLLGDVMEEIGGIIDAGFGFDDATENFNDFLKGVIRGLKGLRNDLALWARNTKEVFAKTFNAINFLWMQLLADTAGELANWAEAAGNTIGSVTEFFGGDAEPPEFLVSANESLREFSQGLDAIAGETLEDVLAPFSDAITIAEEFEAKAAKIGRSGSKKGGKGKLFEGVGKAETEEIKGYEAAVKAAADAINQAKQAGMSEVEAVRARRDVALQEIATVEKAIAASTKLTAAKKTEMRAELDVAKARQAQAASLQIGNLIQKQVDEIAKSNAAAAKAAQDAGKTEVEAAEDTLRIRKEELAVLRQLAVAEGKLSKENAVRLAEAEKSATAARDAVVARAAAAAIEESKKSVADLVKSTSDARAAAEAAGLSTVRAAELATDARLREVAAAREQAAAVGALTPQLEEQLQIAEANLMMARDEGAAKARRAALEEAERSNEALRAGMAREAADRESLIEIERSEAMAAVDAAELKARTEGVFTKALGEELEARRKLINKGAEEKKGSLRMQQAAEVGSAIVAAATVGAAVFREAITGGALDLAANALDAFASIPDMLLESIENLDGILDKFIDAFPTAVAKVLEKLPEVVERFVKELPRIIDQIIAALPQLVKAIADALPDIIGALLDGVADLIANLPAILGPIFEKLPAIVESIFEKLPEIITAIFDAIPQIITQLIKAIPGIVTAIVRALPDIIEAFVSGFVGAMGEIVGAFVDFLIGGGLEKIIVEIIKAVPRIVVALVKGLVSGLQRAFNGIFKGAKLPNVSEGIVEAGEKVGDSISKGAKSAAAAFKKIGLGGGQLFGVSDLEESAKGIGLGKKDDPKSILKQIGETAKAAAAAVGGGTKSFFQKLKDVWLWVWKKVLEPFLRFLKDVWLFVWEKVLEPIVSALREVWLWVWDTVLEPIVGAIRKVWLWVYESVLKPSWEALKKVWLFVYDSIIKPAWELLKTIWDGLVSILKAAWDSIIASLNASWELLKATWTFVYDSILKPAWEALKLIWEAVASSLSAVWSGLGDAWDAVFTQLTAAWEALKAAFGWVKTNIFDPIAKLVSDAFGWVKTNILDKIATVVSDAFGWVKTNILDKISKTVSDAFGWVKTNIFDKMTGWVSDAFSGVSDFFSGIFEGLAGIFDFDFGAFAESLSQAFDGLGDKIAGPFKSLVNGFVDVVNKLVIPKTDVSGKVLGKEFSFTLLPKIDLVPGDLPHFSRGGIVRAATAAGRAVLGGDSVLNDKVLGLFSEGEGVIPREKMANAGIRRIFDMIMSGAMERLPSFAGGGMIAAPMPMRAVSSAPAAAPSVTFSFGDIRIDAAGGQIDQRFIDQKFWPMIEKKLRRATLDGKQLIFSSGVRAND